MKRKSLGRIDLSDPEKPKINFVDLKHFRAALRDFKHDQRVWILVETYHRKRTSSQNGLLHAYLQEISDETGQDMETVKSTVKLLYARKPLLDKDGNEQFNPVTGEILEYVQDTSNMNTVEIGKLIDNTVMFAQDFFGIILTPVGETSELRFKNIQ